MNELKELKNRLVNELADYGKTELTASNLEKIDMLAHAAKNVCKIIESDDDGYSGRWDDRTMRGRYARGRGYSRTGLADKLRELMDESPDDRTRMEIKRLIDRM